ncbi:MAG: hypothetical protein ACI9YB_002714 [Halioglobus sp.]
MDPIKPEIADTSDSKTQNKMDSFSNKTIKISDLPDSVLIKKKR